MFRRKHPQSEDACFFIDALVRSLTPLGGWKAESTTNLFELPFDEISAMKKKYLVSAIEKLNGKL